MEFKNKGHEDRFYRYKKYCQNDNTTLAAVYLLTTSKHLCDTAVAHIKMGIKSISSMDFEELTTFEYTILQCVKDLMYGTNRVGISDFVDCSVTTAKTCRLIFTAIKIARYGI